MLTGVQCNSLDLGFQKESINTYTETFACMDLQKEMFRDAKTKFKVENNYKAHGLSGFIQPLQLGIKRL